MIMIDHSRLNRFTFTPGDLKEVTDEHILAEIKRKYGDISLPPEEQEWVSSEGKSNGPPATSYQQMTFVQNMHGEKHWEYCNFQRPKPLPCRLYRPLFPIPTTGNTNR